MPYASPVPVLPLRTPGPQSSAAASQRSLPATPLPGPAAPGSPVRGSRLRLLSACRLWHFSWCVPVFHKHTFSCDHGAIYHIVRNQLNKVSRCQRSPLSQLQRMKNPSTLLDFSVFNLFLISHAHPGPHAGGVVQKCWESLWTLAAMSWTITRNIMIIITCPSSGPLILRSLCIL